MSEAWTWFGIEIEFGRHASVIIGVRSRAAVQGTPHCNTTLTLSLTPTLVWLVCHDLKCCSTRDAPCKLLPDAHTLLPDGCTMAMIRVSLMVKAAAVKVSETMMRAGIRASREGTAPGTERHRLRQGQARAAREYRERPEKQQGTGKHAARNTRQSHESAERGMGEVASPVTA